MLTACFARVNTAFFMLYILFVFRKLRLLWSYMELRGVNSTTPQNFSYYLNSRGANQLRYLRQLLQMCPPSVSRYS